MNDRVGSLVRFLRKLARNAGSDETETMLIVLSSLDDHQTNELNCGQQLTNSEIRLISENSGLDREIVSTVIKDVLASHGKTRDQALAEAGLEIVTTKILGQTYECMRKIRSDDNDDQ